MDAKLKMTLKNNYHLELIDAVTGEVKQSGDFHNLATKYMRAALSGNYYGSTSETNCWAGRPLMHGVVFGSGTTEPAWTDTKLANELWWLSALSSGASRSFEWLDEYTGKETLTITVPATTSYVGTVTEVGIVSGTNIGSNVDNRGVLCTRALLTDSEGQIISFTKTDTDILKLVLTVELKLSSLTDSFEIFKYNYLTAHTLHTIDDSNSYSGFWVIIGRPNLCRFHNDLENLASYYGGTDYFSSSNSIDQVLSASCVGICDDNQCYIRFPSTRLGSTTITSERYYKGIAIPGIGYWKLPNEDVLPAYSITGIEVGTGDGVTTQFPNPLCYFKANTDKVYKNGVQLTRGVDYTINNIGNSLCLPEVAELLPPTSIKSDLAKVTTIDIRPLFLPTSRRLGKQTEFSQVFSSAYPLYIEYAEEQTFNCLKSTAGWYGMSGTNGFNNLSTTFYLDASTDGETYEEVATVSVTSTSAFSVEFEDTTAKYWRLRTATSSPVALYSSSTETDLYITLNKKDPYITFTTAPADGDVITMDVEMDIIMKNSNFVVDIGCRIDFDI